MKNNYIKKELYVLNFSGGKDSTALLLKLLENNYPIDYILFADTGVEYPEIYNNIKKVNNYIKNKYNKQITIIKNDKDFFYYIYKYKRKHGKNVGKLYGFPTYKYRWCTTNLKINPMNRFLKQLHPTKIYFYVGYALDEQQRFDKLKQKQTNKKIYLAPLITDFKMTEKDCLNYCYKKGFDFDNIYKHLDRASCYVCPFKRYKEINYLIHHRPELWQKIKKIETFLKNNNVTSWKFHIGKSCKDFEQMFLYKYNSFYNNKLYDDKKKNTI